VPAVRTTITLDRELAERARELGVNVSAAARLGVIAAVGAALARSDRRTYQDHPEQAGPFWSTTEAWGDE